MSILPFGMRRALRLLSPELARERYCIAVTVVLAVVSSSALWLVPYCQRWLVDRLAGGDYSRAVWWLAGCGGLLLAIGGCDTLGEYLIRGSGTRIGLSVKRRLLGALMGLPVDSISSLGSGYLSGRLLNDLTLAGFIYSDAAIAGLRNVLKLGGGWVMIAIFDWRVAAVLLPLLPVYWLASRFFGRRQFALAWDYCECNARTNRSLYEFLRNIVLVKSRAAETDSDKRFRVGLEAVEELQYRRFRLDAGFRLVLLILPGACYFAVFLVGIAMIAYGRWSLGGLWALNCYLHYIFVPLQGLSRTSVRLSQAFAAAGRLTDLMDQLPENSPEGLRVERLAGAVEARNLTFGYPGAPLLFENLNFKIAPGEHVAIAGDSGTGKSTLAALLLALRRPTSGTLKVDDVPVTEYELSSYRRRIGFISQISEFFAGTLQENLACGLETPPGDDDIGRAIAAVGLAERLPEAGKTQVMENGANFSVGERLRLALARELLREVDILILDEPTANLDAVAAARTLDLIERIFAGKTVLMISHRESTLARFSRKIELGV